MPVVVCLVLGVITLGLFSPLLGYPFLTYDDQQYVTENPHVQAGLSWSGLVWAFKSFYASNWHPLTWLSHMLDWQIYGSHAWGHHLTNVLLHAANSVLLFLVLRQMTGACWRSACVAALFAWHPLHVQSVAWIAERKDVLSGFFWMLTLWAWVRYAGGGKVEGRRQKGEPTESSGESARNAGWYAVAVSFFVSALLSKPMVVTLPFVLLLLDWWPLGRWNMGQKAGEGAGALNGIIREKIPFLVLAAGACVLTILAQGQSHSLVSTAGLPLGRRLGHALVSYVHYLGAAFVPRQLAVYYPYPEHESGWEILGAGLLLAAITVLVLRAAVRKPYLAVGWFWFIGTLVPVIGVVQVGDQAWADRYTYLPLIGIFLMVVWGVGDLLGSRGSIPQAKSGTLPTRPVGDTFATQGLASLLIALVGGALLAATWSELRWWQSTRVLFERALQVTQRNARATIMVGTFLADDGKIDDAIAQYREALSIRPDDPEAHFFLARAYEGLGKLDRAAEEYNQALWYKPLQERTHIFLGVLRAKQGRTDEAAAHYRAALAINPESAPAENDLARLLHSQGKLDEAIAHYANALRFDPNLAQAHNNLGVLLLQQGKVAEGAAQLREAVRLNPDDAESQYNLASALVQQQQWREGAGLLEKLAPARKDDANLYYQLAVAKAHLGQTRDAMSEYARALLLRPDYPEALDGLSWLLATDPRSELRNGPQALQMSSLACDLTVRKQPAMLATLAAAYAENGQFTNALSTVEKAQTSAAAAGQKDLAARCAEMHAAFKAGKPWRESMGDKR